MSIQLYKVGSTHVVRGVTCELTVCDASQLEAMLKDGWKQSEQDIKTPVYEKIAEQNEKGKNIKSNDEIVKPKKAKKKGKK